MGAAQRGYEGRMFMDGNELTILQDLALPLTVDENEDTTRGNAGLKSTEAGLQEYIINGTVLNRPDDLRFVELKDSFRNRTVLNNIEVDDTRDTTTAHGILCTKMRVTNWTPGKPIDGIQTYDFTLKPSMDGSTVPVLSFTEPA